MALFRAGNFQSFDSGDNCQTIRAVVLFVFALAMIAHPIHARYITPNLVQVPVERLIRNLEELLVNNPTDIQAIYNLARLHGMAYALKTDAVDVSKGQESQGPWFGYQPPHVPFASMVRSADNAEKLKAAKEQLSKAISRYEEVINLQPGFLPAHLGRAWCVEQSGDKGKAIAGYRAVIDSGWQKEKDVGFAPMGSRWITTEAAGYLIPLLDPDKDKTEIDRLKQQVAELRERRPYAITPIVIPLHDGMTAYDVEDPSARVSFNADGTGYGWYWSWISKDAGWLVWNRHGTGSINSAVQLFGNITFWLFWENGYRALCTLDDNGDGLLSGPELSELALWNDTNGNGLSEEDEVKPLAAWGITAISCQYERDMKHPDRIAYSPQGVFFRNGSSRPTYDIILKPKGSERTIGFLATIPPDR